MNDADLREFVNRAGDDPTSSQRAVMRSRVQAALDGELPVAPSPTRPTPRRWLLVGVAATVVIALIVGIAIVAGGSEDKTLTPATEPPVQTDAPAPSEVPVQTEAPVATEAPIATEVPVETQVPGTAAAAPAKGPLILPAGWVVGAMAQPATADGWLIAWTPVDNIPMLLHSVDFGKNWQRGAIPGVSLLDERALAFADANNGWVVGDGRVYSTHDGGATWQSVVLDPANDPLQSQITPMTIAASAGNVHVVAWSGDPQVGFRVYSSPVDSDAFVASDLAIPIGAGPAPEPIVAATADSAWLIVNNRTLIGAGWLRDGVWSPWNLPCEPAPAESASPDTAQLALSPDGSTLVVSCGTSPFSGPPASIRLFTSADGGATFTPTTALPDAVSDGSTAFPAVQFVLVPSANTMVIAYSGATTTHLVVSSDAGLSWNSASPLPSGDSPADGFAFADGGVVVTTQENHAYITPDLGQTWTDIGTGTVQP